MSLLDRIREDERLTLWRIHPYVAREYNRLHWLFYEAYDKTKTHRWLWLYDGFEHFLDDVGDPPSAAHRLYRTEKTEHFRPGNLHWATPAQQAAHRRSQKKVL